jgi:23S rRNA (guanine745-N1)-methyltransferase
VIEFSCSVRGCGEPLAPSAHGLACARGHAFDRARSGYVNLLQPQDRRSLAAGDSKDAVAARRRLYAAGAFEPLLAGLEELVSDLALPPRARVLDVGAGEGSVLARLARRFDLDAAGLDLSAFAAEAAARAYPGLTWIVANGDRRLPVRDGALELVLSITARRAPAEFARVLAPGGRALVVVPGDDDLVELREALLGDGRALAGARTLAEEFAPLFEVRAEREWRGRVALDAAALRDLAAATYRGARTVRETRLAELASLDVTFAWRAVLFERT